jgi:hypothetical protein
MIEFSYSTGSLRVSWVGGLRRSALKRWRQGRRILMRGISVMEPGVAGQTMRTSAATA